MSAADLLILGLAGLLSGTLNAVAGGGTFFSFGALLAVGLPPITANATSAVAMVPGYVASAIAYRREVRGVWRKAILLGIASAIGSVIGALILIGLDNQTFARFVPWLLSSPPRWSSLWGRSCHACFRTGRARAPEAGPSAPWSNSRWPSTAASSAPAWES